MLTSKAAKNRSTPHQPTIKKVHLLALFSSEERRKRVLISVVFYWEIETGLNFVENMTFKYI